MSKEEENKQFGRESKRFGLPDGYFQKSARSVFNKVEWLEEHQEFPVLASLYNKTVFAVPDGYFESGGQRLELLDYPALGAVKKQTVFAVPETYFEELEIAELAKAMNDQETSLEGIKRQNPFLVKETYFRENETKLQEQILKQKRPARVIRLFGTKARMTAAAVLVAVFGTWIYKVYNPPVEVKDCGTIACIDRQELLKSKSLENMETDELYDLVNSKDLEKKLGNDGGKPRKKAKDSLEDTTMDDLLDEI